MDRNERRQLENLYIDNMIQNLPVLRAAIDMTQAGLAERIGVSRQTVVAIERRSRPLTWSLYLAMVLVFTIEENSNRLLMMLNVFDSNMLKANNN